MIRLIRPNRQCSWRIWPGKIGLCVFLLFYLPSAPAAFLDDQTLTVQYLAPNIGTVIDEDDVVVGPGVEYQLFVVIPPSTTPVLFTEIDFFDTGAKTFFRQNVGIPSSSFNGIRVFDTLDAVTAIGSVTLGPTNIPGMDPNRIQFDDDNVWVNMAGLTVSTTSTFELDIQPVPLPAALPLLVTALAGLGFLGWRHRHAE